MQFSLSKFKASVIEEPFKFVIIFINEIKNYLKVFCYYYLFIDFAENIIFNSTGSLTI